jgi:hypothetical protein
MKTYSDNIACIHLRFVFDKQKEEVTPFAADLEEQQEVAPETTTLRSKLADK